MRRLSIALVVTCIASGCGVATTQSAGPPSAASPVAGTAVPGPSVTSSPSTQPCPATSPLEPMSVATYTVADPACFGARDVTLSGWEDIPTGAGSDASNDVLEPRWFGEPTPSILVDRLRGQCATPGEICEPFLSVHLDPASNLRFEGDGIYVVITGHRQDPAAQTCWFRSDEQPSPPPSPNPNEVANCLDKFVLTSVRQIAPPLGAMNPCPSDPVLTVSQYQATDPACFHGLTLRIRGSLDKAPGIDFDGPPIAPQWLAYPIATLPALWSARPLFSGDSPGCPEPTFAAGECNWMLIQVRPKSGVTVPATPRWVILTGHIDDPVAETCHFIGPSPFGGDEIPDATSARQSCRSMFVVTKLENASAPVP